MLPWSLGGVFGSSDCCPGGSLLASMIPSIVFFTDAYCLPSAFAVALALPFAFGLAVPNAPPCGPPDGGSICGTVDFVLMRVRFFVQALEASLLWASSAAS